MTKNSLTRIAPKGDEQIEMFLPDVGDLPIKDKHSLMAYPLLHVGDYRGKKSKVDYVRHVMGDTTVELKAPSDVGIATIRDYDIILFMISAIVDWKNRGEQLSRSVEFHAHSMLKFIRRGHGTKQYEMLEESLTRLMSTTITIKNSSKGVETVQAVGWIDSFTFQRDERTRKFGTVHITLPKWIYDSAQLHKSVLTLHRDYFLLTSPRARWLYRIIRKSAGTNDHGWRFSAKELYERSQTTSTYRQWKYEMRKMLQVGPLLEYHTAWKTESDGTENMYFMQQDQLLKLMKNPPNQLHDFQKVWLSDDTVKLSEIGVTRELE